MDKHPPSQKPLDIGVYSQEVMDTLGYIPPVAAAVLRHRLYDGIKHHRASVLKHHGLPGGPRARRFVAATLSGYAKGGEGGDIGNIRRVSAESFAARPRGMADWEGTLGLLERGGTVVSDQGMAIPIAEGLRRKVMFRKLLAAGKLVIVGPGLLVRKSRGRTGGGGGGGVVDGMGAGARSEIWGIMKKRRVQPARLGFVRQWQSVEPRLRAKLESDVSKMLTAAGRLALEQQTQARASALGAFRATRSRQLAAGGTQRDARKAAQLAYSEVYRDAMERSKGGSR